MSNQGKRKEQLEDAYRLVFWSYGGIILITILTFLLGCKQFNEEVQEGIQNDPRPANHLMNYTIPKSTQAQHNFQVGNITDTQQVIETKEDIDHTGTTQGERTYEEQLSIEPDYIYYDTTGYGNYSKADWLIMQREADSVDAYMRYWYEVLDTNSDGDIDGDYYDMDCGGKVHDTIIEWLEE